MTTPLPAALSDFPTLAEARRLWSANQLDAALERFDAALLAEPENIKAMLEAARAFGQRHEIARAEELLEQASARAGQDPRIAPAIAQTWKRIFRPQRAIDAFEELKRAATPLPLPMLAELATLYEQTNQIDAALEAIQTCVQEAPNQPQPRLILARLKSRQGNPAEAERLLFDLTREEQVPPMICVQAWGELCQLRDRQQDYAGAVAAIEAAKLILRQQPEAIRLSKQALSNNQALRQLYTQIDRSTLEAWRRETLPADPRCSGVAHLLGFPRSGTTLLEQVLDAHPGLVDSPERIIFSRDIFMAMYQVHGHEPLTLSSLQAIPRPHLMKQRKRYLDYMEAALGEPLGGRVHLDKNPNHTSLIAGLIRLFPESRFLVALRDPRDVIVSTYLRNFALTEFSACFLTWGSTCMIYGFEMSIWVHLRQLMDGNWLEVRYEDTVSDLEGQARRALGFLGLPWQASVLDYRRQTAHKIVNSPTHAAVRQPVYQHAIGRWRNYEPYLAPYLDRLEPWIQALGYA